MSAIELVGGMLNRREVCLGIAALSGIGGTAFSAEPTPPEGARDTGIGTVTVVVDHVGAHIVASGSSGVGGLALNGETVFEIGSISKGLTALLLADMVARRGGC